MRVVLASRRNDQVWFPKEMDESQVSLVANGLRHQVILSATDEQFHAMVEQVSTVSAPPQGRARLVDELRWVPMTPKTSRPPVEFYVDENGSSLRSGLLGTFADVNFHSRASSRQMSVLIGSDREEVFGRILLPYASASSSIRVLDQYMFSNIDNGYGTGTLWLLQQFLNVGVYKIALFSCQPSSGHLERVEAILTKSLSLPAKGRAAGDKALIHLVAANHDPAGRGAGGDGPLVHERHIRFRMGVDAARRTPTFPVGPGMDVFAHEKFRESFDLIESPDSGAAREREQRIQDSARGAPVQVAIT